MNEISTGYGNYTAPLTAAAKKVSDTETDTTVSDSAKANRDTLELSQCSRFYAGSETVTSYGSADYKKDTLEHYRFDTVDEEGNKIMDKMSKEETLRTINEISKQYGNNVIVEFSGDALGKLFDFKAVMKTPQTQREIPEGMFTELPAPTPLTPEQLYEMQSRHEETDMEDVMRQFDSEAYKEFQQIKSEGLAKNTPEGLVDGMRYLLKWVSKNAKENPNWMDRYDPNKTAKLSVSERHKNADVFIGDDIDRKDIFSGSKDFTVLLSKDISAAIRSGHPDDKERILTMIDEGMKALSEMREKMSADNVTSDYKLGLFVNKYRMLSFIANNGNKTVSAGSADDLLKML